MSRYVKKEDLARFAARIEGWEPYIIDEADFFWLEKSPERIVLHLKMPKERGSDDIVTINRSIMLYGDYNAAADFIRETEEWIDRQGCTNTFGKYMAKPL